MRPLLASALALTALALAACGADCPRGAAPDPPRRARLSALLAATPAASLPVPAVCFGAVAEPALVAGGPARLPATLSDPEAAAWLAHLAHHQAHGLPTRHFDGRPCADALAAARRDEAAALALEATVRSALGAPPVAVEGRLEQVLASYRGRCP